MTGSSLLQVGQMYMAAVPYDSASSENVKKENPSFIFLGSLYFEDGSFLLRKSPDEGTTSRRKPWSWFAFDIPFMVVDFKDSYTMIIQVQNDESRIGYAKFYHLSDNTRNAYRGNVYEMHVYGLQT